MSSDSVWYLYQNNQQVGPFDTQQITQLLTNKMISHDRLYFQGRMERLASFGRRATILAYRCQLNSHLNRAIREAMHQELESLDAWLF